MSSEDPFMPFYLSVIATAAFVVSGIQANEEKRKSEEFAEMCQSASERGIDIRSGEFRESCKIFVRNLDKNISP
jgi:hypothetical protein